MGNYEYKFGRTDKPWPDQKAGKRGISFRVTDAVYARIEDIRDELNKSQQAIAEKPFSVSQIAEMALEDWLEEWEWKQ